MTRSRFGIGPQRVFAEALDSVRAEPGDIAAIGITNQRETTLVWQGRRTGSADPQRHCLAGPGALLGRSGELA